MRGGPPAVRCHPAHRRSLRYGLLAPFPLHCMVSAPSPHWRSNAPTLPAVWSPSSVSTTLYGFRPVATPALGRKVAPCGIAP